MMMRMRATIYAYDDEVATREKGWDRRMQQTECREGDLCPLFGIYYLGVFRVFSSRVVATTAARRDTHEHKMWKK